MNLGGIHYPLYYDLEMKAGGCDLLKVTQLVSRTNMKSRLLGHKSSIVLRKEKKENELLVGWK